MAIEAGVYLDSFWGSLILVLFIVKIIISDLLLW
jgi:hypothetical protein